MDGWHSLSRIHPYIFGIIHHAGALDWDGVSVYWFLARWFCVGSRVSFLTLVLVDTYERRATLFALVAGIILVGGWVGSLQLVSLEEERMYPDSTIARAPNHPIVVTKDEEDVRLYVDGNIRFSSVDSYRYHETLVHVPSTVR